MDYENMTAPCGLDCFNCNLYLANTNKQLRVKYAKQLAIPEAAAVCPGCRNAAGKISAIGRQESCAIYKCNAEKNTRHCCDCSDFPCEYLQPLAFQADQRPHNTKVYNLCLIKKLGLEKWAIEKAGSVKNTYFNGKFNY